MELGGTLPLIQLLQKSQSPHVQEVVADALWALAGAETECQRTVAEGMGLYKQQKKLALCQICMLNAVD